MSNLGRIFSTKHLGKYFKGQFHIFSHAEVFKKAYTSNDGYYWPTLDHLHNLNLRNRFPHNMHQIFTKSLFNALSAHTHSHIHWKFATLQWDIVIKIAQDGIAKQYTNLLNEPYDVISKVIQKEWGEDDTLETFFLKIKKIHLYRLTLNYFHITASQ